MPPRSLHDCFSSTPTRFGSLRPINRLVFREKKQLRMQSNPLNPRRLFSSHVLLMVREHFILLTRPSDVMLLPRPESIAR